jgi:hypothetical protein
MKNPNNYSGKKLAGCKSAAMKLKVIKIALENFFNYSRHLAKSKELVMIAPPKSRYAVFMYV